MEKQRKFTVTNQVLRCGTSLGANVFEAQQAEKKADFIHKMKIAIEEANETLYWLISCERTETNPNENNLKMNVEEMVRIISKIILLLKREFRM